MTAANVRFLTLAGEPCAADQQPQRFTFDCVRRRQETSADPDEAVPSCGTLLIANSGHGIKRDGQNMHGGLAQWDFDGNHDAPTFSPSINCATHCGWHGYIRNGRCVDTAGQDEP